MKFIIVTGGVISSLGKGITASSIGLILKAYGYRVTAIKIDPYLNVDSDTMSPFEHGEAYVLKDGSVTDLDLGNYERFLGITLTNEHSLTTGKVFNEIIKRERKGDYLGKTVQIVPHVTDYIQDYILRVSQISVDDSGESPEIAIIELGGTIGDIESAMYVEALSQLTRNRLNDNDYMFVHLSLVLTIGDNEVKTKPTQHSIKAVRSQGIYPDLLVLRCSRDLSVDELEKVSRLCQIKKENIIVNYNVRRIYDVPKLFIGAKMDVLVTKKLGLSDHSNRLPDFTRYNRVLEHFNKYDRDSNDVSTVKGPGKSVKVGIVGKYTGMQDTYLSLIRAIEMGGVETDTFTEIVWISSEDVSLEVEISKVDCVIIPGGFGIRGIEGMISAITISRRLKKKVLGICLGCQLIAIEVARNTLGLCGANSLEFGETLYPIVIPCADTKTLGGTMRLGAIKTTYKTAFMKEIYSCYESEHRYRHRYVLNDDFLQLLISGGVIVDGVSTLSRGLREEPSYKGLVSIISVDDYRVIGVQYHPELSSTPDPIIKWLLSVC